MLIYTVLYLLWLFTSDMNLEIKYLSIYLSTNFRLEQKWHKTLSSIHQFIEPSILVFLNFLPLAIMNWLKDRNFQASLTLKDIKLPSWCFLRFREFAGGCYLRQKEKKSIGQQQILKWQNQCVYKDFHCQKRQVCQTAMRHFILKCMLSYSHQFLLQ